jgi:hypothetical protein
MADPKNTLTLNITHNQLNSRLSIDEKIEVNRELISKLLSFVSPSKFAELRPDELKHLCNSFSTLVRVKKISLDESRVYCSSCNEFKSTELSCECYSCSHMNNEIQVQINHIFDTQGEDTLERLENINCSECNKPLTLATLMKIDMTLKEKINNFKTWLIKHQVKTQNFFVCCKCQKFRGKNLLAEDVLSCLHMCKFCISQQYLEGKKKTCVECQTECSVEALSQMQDYCKNCDGIFYLMGDRMVEIVPDHLVCCFCAGQVITNGSCERTGHIFDVKEKRSILKYIYTQCVTCSNDVFFCHARKDKNTKSYYCAECSA